MFFTKAFSLITAFLAVATQASPTPEVGPVEVRIASTTHTGDVTFYTPGLGACGHTNNANEFVAAAAAPVFDTFPGATANPNNNPICGKQTTVTYQGKSVTVTLVDRCPGCGNGGIDLSPAAFQRLASLDKGRLSGAQWSV
ncbi:hypothetical protein E1B28_009434 [Marasmius oreades]|uniref:RlpA-like protein double-psi beta-barrel domain-containing protein n=1 Tax=Marasmius oreades TaxID=181124 RepID=A0A9P7UUB4_9AGAR|nr:uncharacterized protein E1B28_009434 [Marasmius oreades]KAG7093151.1 hypothetical protein E1B28_009434 [Marasmius oreades]